MGDYQMLSIKNVTKKYGKLLANDNINLTVHAGEISLLLGQQTVPVSPH